MSLLLRGGLSTSASITEIAGRGVGLDVVREAIGRLRGEVSVQTTNGQGTSIEILVPVSVSVVPVLTVLSAGAVASIPLDAVRGARRVARRDIVRTSDRESIVHDGASIPYLSLARALRRTDRAGAVGSTVIVAGEAGTIGLGVDRVVGTANVVVRALPELAPADPVVAGANLDAAGNPALVLDPAGLIAAAQRSTSFSPGGEASSLPVLIIDDSLTTRMLEQSILESAGYTVEVAASAEEGLERARARAYRLFLVDVEMPGMDGFEFVRRTRADPVLRAVPAILVTSRNAPEDRRRGVEAGASDYIVKSEFDQGQFLGSVRRLAG